MRVEKGWKYVGFRWMVELLICKETSRLAAGLRIDRRVYRLESFHSDGVVFSTVNSANGEDLTGEAMR